jgi:hypothetical protein
MNTQDPASAPPQAAENRSADSPQPSQRTVESWLDRLRAAVGLRPVSLRTDLAEVLAES